MVAHWVCSECGDEYEGVNDSYVCVRCSYWDDNPAYSAPSDEDK
jgi:hypothetical protein